MRARGTRAVNIDEICHSVVALAGCTDHLHAIGVDLDVISEQRELRSAAATRVERLKVDVDTHQHVVIVVDSFD